jgi:DNA polymerase-3 subunit alpha
MKIINIQESTSKKLVDGTLPDIDTDFAGRDRAEIKQYMEDRFGQKQVCSVGSYSTMKLKGLVKDFARISSVGFSEANLITSIIDAGDSTMLDLIKRASGEPKLKSFIKRNSEIFYMIPTILDQPKTQSIHPCAVIIFPKVMSASEWVPTRTTNGLLVSEWSGGEMDDAGFLKDDILGIKQLDKFTDILSLIEKNGKEVPNIYNLPHDQEVFRYFGNGWNGDVFQLGSSGLTEYTKSLKPQSLEDLIATNALYRPGPMENGYHDTYIKCKNEGRVPEYLWGTESIAKDTFGLLIYQEQVMQVFQEVGGLSMKEADDVRRAMGKKKLSVLLPWKERVAKGFLERGATQAQFDEVWIAVMEFAKYGFNKSHSAAYAMTGYVSQYLKVHYPIEYWTVALNYANEEDTLKYLSEILQAKAISIKAPDINESGMSMLSNQDSSTIFWGLGSIKGIGEDTAMQIINERNKNGNYLSFADFYFRHIFKGSKVKKQTFEALIASGCFDELYNFEGQEEKRFSLINRFRIYKKVKIANPKRDAYTIGQTDQRWWWSLQQKRLTGLAFIDYKQIAEDMGVETQFLTLSEANQKQERSMFRSFGGYIVEAKIGRGAKGEYCRITIEHNYKLFKIMVWSEEFVNFKPQLKGSEKNLIIFDAELRYDAKWSKANQFTIKENSKLIVL